MILMVAGDMTPTLVPFGLVAIVLTAMGLIATIALIVRDERLRSRAMVEVGMHRHDMNPADTSPEDDAMNVLVIAHAASGRSGARWGAAEAARAW